MCDGFVSMLMKCVAEMSSRIHSRLNYEDMNEQEIFNFNLNIDGVCGSKMTTVVSKCKVLG